MSRLWPVLGLLVLAVLLVADASFGCAVCGGLGDDIRSRDSYLNATIFMSVLPVGLVGSAAWYLRRRMRRRGDL